jgi:tetratricopeptide (TPR) repeat protein
MFAYLVGFGGGKERGIHTLEAATADAAVQVEAKSALALIYSRERRHADAFRLLGELAAAFPQNRLFVLEQGSAGVRAGKHKEAEALLTKGLTALAQDPRPKIPGEQALWLYKRALARFNQDRFEDAQADLQESLRHQPVGWVRGRTMLALGRIADVNGRRQDAVAAYRTARDLATTAKDAAAVSEASRLMREPYVKSRP